MAKSTYSLSILGSSFTLSSGDDTPHLEEVAEYFRSKIEEVQAELPTAQPTKIALLAGLNLADELLKERRRREEPAMDPTAAGEIESIASRLIARTDESLGPRTTDS